MLRRPLYTFARWLERKTAPQRLVGRFEGQDIAWERDCPCGYGKPHGHIGDDLLTWS